MAGLRMAAALAAGVVLSTSAWAAEAGRGGVYSVVELAFRGPPQEATAAPTRDIDFRARFRHESGSPEYVVHGFHDGGNAFKVRFCPTRPGRWDLVEVKSNARELDAQRQGDHVTATPSKHPGFWEPDPDSPGRRWYRRSDGSHQFIFGNTHYSFLSGYGPDGKPVNNDIAADVAGNARFFKKLRFSLHCDRYPNPTEKPFLDDAGRPTDSGDYSHRPNPRWFQQRADRAVRAAYDHDLIADLVLAGPDTEDSRATLRARGNGGDPTPYLKYVAARYGSYPNVWVCLCNEYDIKSPKYTEAEVAKFGQAIRDFLPYPTPLSVHASQRPGSSSTSDPQAPAWSPKFDDLPAWNDHQIIQRKLKTIAAAADVNQRTWQLPGGRPRNKPTINDELSYQGEGDKHTEHDTIESHLGAFLGGGYGTTGEKRGNKLGHYFWGKFDPAEHTAAVSLGWLRERIDAHVTFWKMAPDAGIFSNLDPAFRAMAWTGREYVLGTDKAAKGVVAELPAGTWTVRRFDVIARQEVTLAKEASGRFTFDAPASRAVLFHFKKNESSAQAVPSAVPKWSVHEITLVAAKDAPDAEVMAAFTGPGGARKTVRGFWDGGRTYKLRFTPTAEGAWSYATQSADAGLNGQTGSLRCTSPAPGQHGFLRCDAEYPTSFVYDDGTRCFLWGQTYYRLLDGALAGDRWKEAIDRTRAYGMNKVRFYVYPRIATAGGPDPQAAAEMPSDPAYWRKLDEVVRYLGERGVIADLILASKNYRFGDDERDRRYVRGVVARYAAFPNVAFCLSNEWNYTPQPRPYWNALGELVRAEDPWAVEGRQQPRLLSIHQQTRWDFQFFDQKWLSHAIVQVGVRNGQAARFDEFKEAELNKGGRIREGDLWGNRSILVNWGHKIPVVNDEYGYIGEPEDKSEPKVNDQFVRLTREKHRHIIWGIATAGGYGSAGDKTDHPGGRPYSVPTYWQDVPEYGDVKRLVDFFTTRGVEFWKMAGRNDMIKSGKRVYALADPGGQYVLYAAVGGTFAVELPPGEFVASRYDPRTGQEQSLGPVAGGVRSFTLPAGDDWVVHVKPSPARGEVRNVCHTKGLFQRIGLECLTFTAAALGEAAFDRRLKGGR